MEHKQLFAPAILDAYYRLILGRLNLITEKIKVTAPANLYKALPEVSYKTFVYLLNTLPLGLVSSSKIAYVNAMVDYFNKTKNRHPEFPAIRKAFTNMALLTFGSEETTAFVKGLSRKIGQVPSLNKDQYEKKETSSRSPYVWVIVALFVLFRIAIRNSGSDDSSAYYPTARESTPLVDTEVLQGLGTVKHYLADKERRNGDKRYFFEYLEDLGSDDMATIPPEELYTRFNPYASYFHNFPQVPSTFLPTDFYNYQKDGVIVFRLNQWREGDRAAYFRPNSFLRMGLSQGDSLLFYSGKHLAKVMKGSGAQKDSVGGMISYKFKEQNPMQRALGEYFYVIDSLGQDPGIILDSGQNLRISDIFYHKVRGY